MIESFSQIEQTVKNSDLKINQANTKYFHTSRTTGKRQLHNLTIVEYNIETGTFHGVCIIQA